MGLTAGVDVGGTYAKVIVADERGAVLREARLPTLAREGAVRFIGRLSDAVRAECRSLSRPLRAAGIGIAGEVDGIRGVLHYSPNLAGWRRVDFKKALERRLDCPVRVENDANVAAWALFVLESKRRSKSLLAVTLGTGVGGGLVIGGKLYAGAGGTAGEIGHTTVHPGGEPCGCGGRGHLESYAGGRGMLRRYGRLSGRRTAGLTPLDVADRARRGDAAAKRVWSDAGTALGLALGNAAYLLDPDTIIITGGLSGARALLEPSLRRSLKTGRFTAPFRGLKIAFSRRPNPGALGAALLAFEKP